MKNTLYIAVFLTTTLFSKQVPFPPMPPGMIAPVKKQVSKKNEDPCALIPPMLYKLPKPLLNLVDKCQTKLLKPTKESVKKALIKNNFSKDVNVISVELLDNSHRLYKIKLSEPKKKSWILNKLAFHHEVNLICDENIKLCFKDKPLFIHE